MKQGDHDGCHSVLFYPQSTLLRNILMKHDPNPTQNTSPAATVTMLSTLKTYSDFGGGTEPAEECKNEK
jgi:hypothetical protein